MTCFLSLLGLPWRVWVAGLVPPLVLGLPLLLAGWAWWRLRGASSAGGAGRAYLLANYAAAVQLSNLQGEQALMIVSYLISFQLVYIYSALQILLLWRSVPVGVGLVGVAIVGWLAYRFVGPAVAKYFKEWNIAATRDRALPRQRRAWALLGHACFWGCFTFIFVIIILREYYL